MRPAFEQIDEAAGKARLGVAAGIDGHEIAHGAGERKAIDLPYAERCPQAIANLDQDNLVAAAAFARRVTVPAIVIDVSREILSFDDRHPPWQLPASGAFNRPHSIPAADPSCS